MNSLSTATLFQQARAAQSDWAMRSPGDRTRVLIRLRREIAAKRRALVDAIVSDSGKPPLDALGGDVLVTLEHMRFYERHAKPALRPRSIGSSSLFYRGCTFTESYEPHGVVLVFGPANYPLQLCMVPAVTALYAGNAVVLKVSERTRLFAREIADVIQCSGLPEHLLQVVCTAPDEAHALIEAEPDFVFFTGSTTNGRAVAATAAARGIPSLLELGGSDPAIVFADCHLERTLEGILYGAFSNAGQVCVGVKRLFIEQSLYRSFINELVRRAASLRIGSHDECDLGLLQTDTENRRLQAQIEDALKLGAHLETDGADGKPVILSNVSHESRLLNEEVFSPVLCVRPFVTEGEAIALANLSQFALSSSVWTSDLHRGRRVAEQLNGGSCAINDVVRNIANPHAAFGGNGASGFGRYHGVHGLRAFRRVKTTMVNRSSRPREVNWFPLTRKKYHGLDSLIGWRYEGLGIWKSIRRALSVAIVVALLMHAHAGRSQTAHLTLQVNLPKDAHGPLAYLVFNSPDGFPQDKNKARIHGFTQPVHGEETEAIDLGELPSGRYAVSVYLDENSNGKLDSTFIGIPKEPVGVSNNPRKRMGPPRYQDAVFTLNSSTNTIEIDLVRP